MKDTMGIGFFDSGVGGITVLHKALKLLPGEDYIYYADTFHVPYGEKPLAEVRKYIFEAVEFIAQQQVKALVIACNAATSAAVRDLRERYPFPIMGIEPAVKPAIQQCQGNGKRVLVLATRLTLREEKFQNLVARLDDEHIVDGLALPGLVEFAEKFQFDEQTVRPYLEKALAPYDLNRYGTVVLGCTHFPLFKDTMRKIFPAQTAIIDGAQGTVMNLKRNLENQDRLGGGSGAITYYTSGIRVDEKEKLAQFQTLLAKMDEIERTEWK
ncbi:asp/glu racemase [Lucifera butyrica]|uniref:Glutamate racemase n=1 Tax=Lucifera butyrica TaxID=1351585 RepID=A0A498R7V2_9FIRM|nr:glutamate racemase [Lucifera butyrica]VBB07055.1 asp/glu racemase [Lucifera butyrica]